MSRNAKRVRIQILNPPEGCQANTSLEHARRYVKRGTAEWDGGAIRFIHRRQSQAQTPNIEVIPEAVIHDSGFSLAVYPMPMLASGARFPALARQGAGL